jgi:hypothetical protein
LRKGEVMPFSIFAWGLGITDDLRVSSYPTVTLLFVTAIRRKSVEDLICDCHIKNIFLAFIIF